MTYSFEVDCMDSVRLRNGSGSTWDVRRCCRVIKCAVRGIVWNITRRITKWLAIAVRKMRVLRHGIQGEYVSRNKDWDLSQGLCSNVKFTEQGLKGTLITVTIKKNRKCEISLVKDVSVPFSFCCWMVCRMRSLRKNLSHHGVVREERVSTGNALNTHDEASVGGISMRSFRMSGRMGVAMLMRFPMWEVTIEDVKDAAMRLIE